MINLDAEPDNAAEAVEQAYGRVIADAIKRHPRSLQKRIGPSQIGEPCDKALLHALAGAEEPETPDMDVRLEAPYGTAWHAQLEEWFGADNKRYSDIGPSRWLIEERVEVGTIGGQVITGSTDLFDTNSGYVIDHKMVSASRHRSYRLHGPGQKYLVQAMLYCRGWAMDGWAVKGAAIAFFPRNATDQKGVRLQDIHFHTIPYDEQIALDALDRANKRWGLINALGLEQALTLFEPCTDDRDLAQRTGRPFNKDHAYCDWCADNPMTDRFGAAAPVTTLPNNPTGGVFASPAA